jgi:hypothetical protein
MSSTTSDRPVRKLSGSSSLPQETPRVEGFQEVDLQLHSQLGHLSGNFPCIYNGTKGTLFCGSGGCSFVGWTLFFEKRVELDWKRVLQVVHSTNDVNGITFVMQHEHEEYTFTALPHAERVWATLVNLHNESLFKNQQELLVSTTPSRRTSLRRMSTDPVYPTTISAGNGTTDTNSVNGPSIVEAAYVAAASVACNEEFRAPTSSRNLAAKSVSSRKSQLWNTNSPERQTTETSDDLQQAWKELTNGANDKESYATTAIQDKILPCTLDDFLDKFIGTDALFPYSTYMQSSGDDVLQVTEWKRDEQHGVYSRMLEYNHPVNAPLAPPMAKARKEQRYRRFGEMGLSIETDTFVQDVPMADCFFVTDRVLVEPTAGENGTAVLILAEFDIRFIKSTMFRSLISNTTKSEFLKWFQGLGEYWSESIVSPMETEREEKHLVAAGSVETVLVKDTKPPVVMPLTGMLGQNPLLTILVILVLVMQLWTVMEISSMKRAMLEIESEMAMRDVTCQTLDTTAS